MKTKSILIEVEEKFKLQTLDNFSFKSYLNYKIKGMVESHGKNNNQSAKMIIPVI